MTTFKARLRDGFSIIGLDHGTVYDAEYIGEPVGFSQVKLHVEGGTERAFSGGRFHQVFERVAEATSALDTTQRADEPALRFDADKSRIDLIDPGFIMRLGDHYGAGAKKYAERNWERGMSYSRCYGSAQRHMLAFWAGEDEDVETGSRHVIAAAWNMAAIDFYMNDPELSKKFDDRPKKPA